MGPRMREDKGGVFTPVLTFPLKGEGRGRRAPRGTPLRGKGARWVMGMAHSNGMEGVERGAVRFRGSARNGTGGRGGKMGPRMREDKGGAFTPILTFPLKREGRGRRVPTRGAPTGGNRVRRSWECHHLGG